MIAMHVFNPKKKDLKGSVFHMFFADSTEVTVYDSLMDDPIVRGRPVTVSMMIRNFKNINNPFVALKDREVTFFVYKKTNAGFFDNRPWPPSKEKKMSEVILPVSG